MSIYYQIQKWVKDKNKLCPRHLRYETDSTYFYFSSNSNIIVIISRFSNKLYWIQFFKVRYLRLKNNIIVIISFIFKGKRCWLNQVKSDNIETKKNWKDKLWGIAKQKLRVDEKFTIAKLSSIYQLKIYNKII